MTGHFCERTRRKAYREIKMRKVYFCMLVLQYHVINHGVPGPSGTFSRETVRIRAGKE